MSRQAIGAGDIIRNRQNPEYRNTVESTYVGEYGQPCVSYIDGGWDFVSSIEVIEPSQPLPAPKSTYKLIEHSNPDALSTAVNAAILEGFKPIGGVSMSMHKHYMQAMLKE